MTGTPPTPTGPLDGALDRAGMVACCQAMVRCPSLPGEEGAAAALLADWLRHLGYDRVEIDDRGNVLAWLIGDGSGSSLMFNGHLDHVPPGTMTAPYGGQLVDATRWGETGEAIFGRGSCDMKCNVVAAAFGAAAVRRAGIPMRGTFVFTADVGEEVDSPDGIQHILARGIAADYGISGESTGLGVFLGHRGKVEFELTVRGRTAHSSEPGRGVNAIVGMSRLVAAIERHGRDLAAHPLLGAGSIAPIDVAASPGGGVAVVPDRCTLRVDRRFVPGEGPETCRRELDAIVNGVRQADPTFACGIEQVNLYPLFFTPADHPLVATVAAAREAVLGGPAPLGAWRFGVNATFMAQAGIPTVGFGPGDERWAHTPEEHVLVDDLVAAARVYARLVADLCGPATGLPAGAGEREEA